MRPQARRRVVAVCALAFAAVALAAAPASAHATLETSTPANGARLDPGRPPGAVSLKFSENVEIPKNAITVLSAGHGAVDVGEVRHGTTDSVVSVALPKLADGTYVVSWRVVSADSHVISGALSFGVGASPGAVATALPSGPGPNRVVGFVFGLDRTIAFLAILVLIGGSVFARAMWPAGSDHRGVRRLVGAAWLAALVTSVAGLGFQGVASAGEGLGSFFDRSLVSDVLGTDYGQALAGRAALLVIAAPILLLLPRRRRTVDAAAAWLAIGIVLTFVPAGHAHTGRWVEVAMGTDVLHVSAAGVWFGGLAALAVTLVDKQAREHARYSVVRFSAVAAPAIALVALSGVVQSLRQVGDVVELFDTNYGRLLLVKVGIVIAIVAVASTSRRIATTRLAGEPESPPANRSARRNARTAERSAVSALRKAVLVEVAFAIVVLAVTAALTNTQPARDVPSGKPWPGAPFAAELPAAPLTLAVSVVPGHTGRNRVELTPRSAARDVVRVVDIAGSISQPAAGVARLAITFARQPDGSYAADVDIPLPGIWQLELSVLRTQFDESRATADLPVGVGSATSVPKPSTTTPGLSPAGIARIVRPYRDTLLAGLARDTRECDPPVPAGCRKLLDDMDAAAVALSRKLRTSNPVFEIESTMYFTVDIADEFSAGLRSYLATGCADSPSKVPAATCRRQTHLYRDPAPELERNLRGWDQYLATP